MPGKSCSSQLSQQEVKNLLRTIFPRPQASTGQLKKGAPELKEQHMGMVVFPHEQDSIHRSAHPLLSISAEKDHPCQQIGFYSKAYR